MTFFYDLNKRLANIADTPQTRQLNEGAVAEADYAAKKARAGQDIGKPGKQFAQIAKSAGERYGSKESGEKVAGAVLAKLRKGVGEGNDGNLANNAKPYDKVTRGDVIAGRLGKDEMGGKHKKVKEADMDESALQKAGRDGASKEKMDRIRDQHDKMDEGFDEMEKYVDRRRSEVRPGHKVAGAKGEIEKTATGIRHTRRYDAKTGETDTGDDAPASGEKRGRGRPKGTGKSMGAKGPSGKSKLMTSEGDQDPAEKGEYDREGDMALDDIDTIESAANELKAIIDADENLPEWVQSKINKAMDYLDTARDYMKAQGNDAEPVTEKAVSKAQQKFMGMAHTMQKGEKIAGASKELEKVAKTMKKGDVKDFAKTKHKGLPEKKKKEETDESTTAGSVATAPSGGSKGGYSFGKGIYDSYNREVEAMIAESMNISMNANSDGGDMGGGTRSLTVTATDEDAAKLAALLKMAGLGSGEHQMDETYGVTETTKNQPDYPTNQEQAQDNFEYAGGLNKPKSTGQSTVPVLASQEERQITYEDDELARMLEMAGQPGSGLGAQVGDTIDYINPKGEQPPEDLIMQNGVQYDPDTNVISVRNATSLANTHRAIEAAGWQKQNAGATPNPAAAGQAQQVGDTPYQLGEDELKRMMEMAGIREAAKPDYIDLDKDGNRKESMKKAAADKDNEDKEVKESILAMTNLWTQYKG